MISPRAKTLAVGITLVALAAIWTAIRGDKRPAPPEHVRFSRILEAHDWRFVDEIFPFGTTATEYEGEAGTVAMKACILHDGAGVAMLSFDLEGPRGNRDDFGRAEAFCQAVLFEAVPSTAVAIVEARRLGVRRGGGDDGIPRWEGAATTEDGWRITARVFSPGDHVSYTLERIP